MVFTIFIFIIIIKLFTHNLLPLSLSQILSDFIFFTLHKIDEICDRFMKKIIKKCDFSYIFVIL